jgi:hypothetical protein
MSDDPVAADPRATDTHAKRILFEEASSLLDEKGIFMLAVRSLRRQWFGKLMDAKDWETKDDLTRKLQVLTAVPEELNRFVTDYKFAMDRQKKHAGRP